jgi:metal-responsive CopG/Arc/MetJ family transcriptional regulator
MKRVNFVFPDKLYKELRKDAKRQETTMSALVRVAIRILLDMYEKEKK